MAKSYVVTVDEVCGIEVWSPIGKIVGRKYYLIWNGERLTSRQWAERVGIREITIIQRVEAGWTATEILSTPPLNRSERANPGKNGKHDAALENYRISSEIILSDIK